MANIPEVIIGDVRRTNTQIRERAARLASALRDIGVKADDAVALIAKNDFVCLELSLATQQMDAFVVPINWHWQAPEVSHVIHDSGAKIILAHHEYVPLIRSVAPLGVQVIAVRPSWESPDGAKVPDADIADYDAWIQSKPPAVFKGSGRGSSMIYTSGTTGKPKAVRRMPANAAEVEQRRQLLALVYNCKPGKVALTSGPLYHLFSLAVATSNFGADASVVIMDRFEPEEFLRLVEKYRVTTVGLVPTMFVRLLRLSQEVRNKYDLSSLEYVMHTAAPCPPDVKKQMIEWLGPIVWENYGSSETGVITLINSPDWLAHPGTVGRAVLTGEIRIYDEAGNRLPPGTVGTIYLKMHGSPDFTYHGNPEARAKVGCDGFATCGDVGYLDEEGYLYLCDRKSDMLISGGVNIYPQEIESALLSHPEVMDAAVFGIPDDEYGEVVAAHVQKTQASGLTADDLRVYLRDRLAKYKIPRKIVFEEQLPRQDNGKIYKRGIRDKYWAGRERRI